MPRRPATVTQADVARTIRAAVSAGLTVVRLVTRADGVSIETSAAPVAADESAIEPERKVVL